MKAHSKVGASSMYRWQKCPGSVVLSEQAPRPGDSPASIEGTNAHSLMEVCLKKSVSPVAVALNPKKYGLDFQPDEQMVNAIAYLSDEVMSLVNESGWPPRQLFIEERIQLSFIDKELFGTADIIIYQPGHEIHIIDLKYGDQEVEAELNPQLLYYALGASYGRFFTTVKVSIYQPKICLRGLTTFAYSPIDLHEYAEKLRAALLETRKPDALLCAGDHCFFCPAMPICPERAYLNLAAANERFFDHTKPIEEQI